MTIIMTIIRKLSISVLGVLIATMTYAQVDYYSGCETIKSIDFVYCVTHDNSSIVIENINNTLSHVPIVWTDSGVRAMAETRPLARRDEKTIHEIVNSVFTRKEIRKYRRSKNSAEIGVIIDSHTGQSLEVSFYLTNFKEYNDPILYSIPIHKFEELEKLIKKNLVWEVAPGSENASHIGLSIHPFIK